MVRYLPFLFEFALLLYALVDCIQTDERRIRNLPKLVWVIVVVLIPFAGPVAWLFAGRPARESGSANWPVKMPPVVERPRERPLAPDDDPEFLATLKKQTAHEDLLKKWEDDLKRREGDLKHDKDADKPDPDADAT